MSKIMCVAPIKMLVEMELDEDSNIVDWIIAPESVQATADFIDLIGEKISQAARDSSASAQPGHVFTVDLTDIMSEIYELGSDELTNEEQKAVDEAKAKDTFFIHPSASNKVH